MKSIINKIYSPIERGMYYFAYFFLFFLCGCGCGAEKSIVETQSYQGIDNMTYVADKEEEENKEQQPKDQPRAVNCKIVVDEGHPSSSTSSRGSISELSCAPSKKTLTCQAIDIANEQKDAPKLLSDNQIKIIGETFNQSNQEQDNEPLDRALRVKKSDKNIANNPLAMAQKPPKKRDFSNEQESNEQKEEHFAKSPPFSDSMSDTEVLLDNNLFAIFEGNPRKKLRSSSLSQIDDITDVTLQQNQTLKNRLVQLQQNVENLTQEIRTLQKDFLDTIQKLAINWIQKSSIKQVEKDKKINDIFKKIQQLELQQRRQIEASTEPIKIPKRIIDSIKFAENQIKDICSDLNCLVSTRNGLAKAHLNEAHIDDNEGLFMETQNKDYNRIKQKVDELKKWLPEL